jgi:hypothetical protein
MTRDDREQVREMLSDILLSHKVRIEADYEIINNKNK